jgi:tRNA1(Val) A37 N6-methylase TrmN6
MQTRVLLVSSCLQGMVALRHTNDKITHICSLHIEEQVYQSATMAVEINKMATDINITVLDESCLLFS